MSIYLFVYIGLAGLTNLWFLELVGVYVCAIKEILVQSFCILVYLEIAADKNINTACLGHGGSLQHSLAELQSVQRGSAARKKSLKVFISPCL